MLQQYECPVCGKPTQVVFCAKTSEVCCSVCGYVFDEHYEAYADDPAKKPKYATLAVSALGCAPPNTGFQPDFPSAFPLTLLTTYSRKPHFKENTNACQSLLLDNTKQDNNY